MIDAAHWFQVVQAVGWLLPPAVAAAVVLAPRPLSARIRVPAAIASGWLSCVWWTIAIINPAGTAAAIASGVDPFEAAMHFDNNTSAISVMWGWLLPLLAASIAHAVREVRG